MFFFHATNRDEEVGLISSGSDSFDTIASVHKDP